LGFLIRIEFSFQFGSAHKQTFDCIAAFLCTFSFRAGKSNLLDAVSFALGEIPANLRAKTISDLSAIPGRKVEVELQFELAALEVLSGHEISTSAGSKKKKIPGVLR